MTTVRTRIALAMTVLITANALGVGFSWWAYSEAARYSAEARAASVRAAMASAAAERVTAWSADIGTLAFAARQAKTSEELSGTYGNVIGSESVATTALQRIDSQFGQEAQPLARQWSELRTLAYVWVNAEATDGGTALRISRTPDGRFRASVDSNLIVPIELKGSSTEQLRGLARQQTEALKDGALRRIAMNSEQAAVAAALKEDRAREMARNGIVASLLGGFFLAVAVSIWLYRSIARPLTSARTYADRVADGDWNTPSPGHRSDEIGALTHAVENMKDAFVRKATIMTEMAGAVLVTAGQVDAAAKHAQRVVASDGMASADLASDLAAVAAKTEVLTGLAAQMLQD